MHPLPDNYSTDDFKTILGAIDDEFLHKFSYNNAEFSKKATERLFVEIKAFMIKVILDYSFTYSMCV